MHLRANRVETPSVVRLEDVDDASNHVEALTPHQPEAVGGDDAYIHSEKEDPIEMLIEEDDGETGGS
ncbi:hypothetical protein TIFTF001_021746 [Ficus carica]|uniref:Uncharacterized protein n=1 Tax=Ficus carica TaxID=3494 RepID=A0AA88AV61_FICCA|nr:hypothetical protein TIFTF001_021746 [Ficus carica]